MTEDIPVPVHCCFLCKYCIYIYLFHLLVIWCMHGYKFDLFLYLCICSVGRLVGRSVGRSVSHSPHSPPGVAKSIVRVVRVVHLLLRTSNFFQLTCPWTSEKILYRSMCLFPNDSSRNRKFTNSSLFLFQKFGS